MCVWGGAIYVSFFWAVARQQNAIIISHIIKNLQGAKMYLCAKCGGSAQSLRTKRQTNTQTDRNLLYYTKIKELSSLITFCVKVNIKPYGHKNV